MPSESAAGRFRKKRTVSEKSLKSARILCYNNRKKKQAGEILKIQESAENYLETILILKKRNGTVRSIDIANELEYSKPSVSIAMKNLRENGYIEMESDGSITLLEKGLEIAERMYERHTLLSDWLMRLGVQPKTAAEDACRMEHVISAESFEAIKHHASREAAAAESKEDSHEN